MSTRTLPPKGSVYGDRWRRKHASQKRSRKKAEKAANEMRAKIESRIRMGDKLARDIEIRLSHGVVAHLFDFRTFCPTGRSLCAEVTIEGSTEACRVVTGSMPSLMFYLPNACEQCLEKLVAR